MRAYVYKYKYKMIERNSLINGDCLEVMKGIEDKSIDMILCNSLSGLKIGQRLILTKNFGTK
jgi:DNA modification methylase